MERFQIEIKSKWWEMEAYVATEEGDASTSDTTRRDGGATQQIEWASFWPWFTLPSQHFPLSFFYRDRLKYGPKVWCILFTLIAILNRSHILQLLSFKRSNQIISWNKSYFFWSPIFPENFRFVIGDKRFQNVFLLVRRFSTAQILSLYFHLS